MYVLVSMVSKLSGGGSTEIILLNFVLKALGMYEVSFIGVWMLHTCTYIPHVEHKITFQLCSNIKAIVLAPPATNYASSVGLLCTTNAHDTHG